MSTETLVDVCMSYPLALDCFAFNSVDQGINRVISNFNGFKILRLRIDSFEKMLEFYSKKLDEIEMFGNTIGYEINPLKIAFYEHFLMSGYLCEAQELSGNSEFIAAVKKARKLRESFYALQGQISLASLRAMEIIINNGTIFRSPISESIVTVYTESACPVTAIKRICINNSEENEFGRQFIENNYPNVEIIADASCTYNCHAYAWYVSEGGEQVWINKTANGIGNVSKFWSDGTYETTTLSNAQKAFDSVNDHSALILNNGKFLSKWGAYQLVQHNINECPYWNGTTNDIQYFRYVGPPCKNGKVYWDMDPLITPINTCEDFYIDDTYDLRYFSVDVFVSSPKEPTEPVGDDIAEIIYSTEKSANIYFKKYGVYYVCFKVCNKLTGNIIALYLTEDEIYVSNTLTKRPEKLTDVL